jgi:hypothetical protein
MLRPATAGNMDQEDSMQSTGSLRGIREGMKVFDSRQEKIGEVEYVKFGDDDPATPEVEASGINPTDTGGRDTLIDNIADAFRTDELPEEVREKLLLQGFIRIDADGLFAADRYVTPDQIGGVTEDGVTLTVSKDELLKRH